MDPEHAKRAGGKGQENRRRGGGEMAHGCNIAGLGFNYSDKFADPRLAT